MLLNLFGFRIDTRPPVPEWKKSCHKRGHPFPHAAFHDGSGSTCTNCKYQFETKSWRELGVMHGPYKELAFS